MYGLVLVVGIDRMALLLDRSEKSLQRTTRTSLAFRDEISKTNAKITQSVQSAHRAEQLLQEKNDELEALRRHVRLLEEQLSAHTKEAAVGKNKTSSVCVVS